MGKILYLLTAEAVFPPGQALFNADSFCHKQAGCKGCKYRWSGALQSLSQRLLIDLRIDETYQPD